MTDLEPIRARLQAMKAMLDKAANNRDDASVFNAIGFCQSVIDQQLGELEPDVQAEQLDREMVGPQVVR